MRRWTTAMLFCALSGLVGAGDAQATDTLEPFERGAFDVEYYFAYSGLGRTQQARHLGGELVVGYGITERISLYTGAGIVSNEELTSAAGLVYAGGYASLLDTRHLDLDLGLQLFSTGDSMTVLGGMPFVELNLDHTPEMSTFGAYLRVGVPVGGNIRGEGGVTVDMEAVLGAYLTLAGDHMLMLEIQSLFPFRNADSDVTPVLDYVALGYNVSITEVVEVLSEVSVVLPDGQNPLGLGFSVGMILTLPSAG